MKRHIFLIIISIAFFKIQAIEFSLPQDQPTLEALIDSHKKMKKAEDRSLAQMTLATGEQEVITSESDKYSDVKTTIQTKMKTANAYLILATSIGRTLMNLENLIEEYKAFITETSKEVKNKPYLTNFYVTSHQNIKKEGDKLAKKINTFIAAGINLLRCSMDEKFKFIYQIDDSVNNMRSIITNSSNYIKYTDKSTLYKLSAKEMYSKELRENLCNQLLDQWNQPFKL